MIFHIAYSFTEQIYDKSERKGFFPFYFINKIDTYIVYFPDLCFCKGIRNYI